MNKERSVIYDQCRQTSAYDMPMLAQKGYEGVAPTHW
jgi:hypothetical protein